MKVVSLLVFISLTLSVISQEKETVLDLLWKTQRDKLLKWGITLKLQLGEETMDSGLFDLTAEDLRQNIKDIITRVNSYKIDRLNRNPDSLDQLSEDLGVNQFVSDHYDNTSSKKEKLPKEMINVVKRMGRDQMIDLVKIIDSHVKRGRDYLAEGVLASLEQMTDEQIQGWILNKLEKHQDLQKNVKNDN